MYLDFQEVRDIQTSEELERFLLDHGEQIIDTLGQEVDRIERNIKVGTYVSTQRARWAAIDRTERHKILSL